MNLHYSLNPGPQIKNAHISLGFFDGLHFGHQLLMKKLLSRKSKGEQCWVISFYPHPVQIIKPDLSINLLFPREDLLNQLKIMGIDGLWIIPFTQSIVNLTPDQFLQSKIDPIQCKSIVVGEDYRFGNKASGDIKYLSQWCDAKKISFTAVKKETLNGREISSTWIRECLMSGDLEVVKKLIGRNFYSTGVVVSGKKLGRELGFPTANVVPEKNFPVQYGVYVANVNFEGGSYLSVVNIGVRPTIEGIEPLIEAHLLDFSGDLYGKVIKIEWIKKIRDEKKFVNLNQLKLQIQNDIVAAKQVGKL